MLCITWQPDGDVVVCLGLTLNLFSHSSLVKIPRTLLSVVHFFKCWIKSVACCTGLHQSWYCQPHHE